MRRTHAVETCSRRRKREQDRRESTVRIQRDRSKVRHDNRDERVKDSSMLLVCLGNLTMRDARGDKKDEERNVEVCHAWSV